VDFACTVLFTVYKLHVKTADVHVWCMSLVCSLKITPVEMQCIDLICSMYVVYFEQSSAHDETFLSQLCQCFRLFSFKGHHARGVHHGLIR